MNYTDAAGTECDAFRETGAEERNNRRATHETRLTYRAELPRACSVRQAESDVVGVCRPGHAAPGGCAGLVDPDPFGKDRRG